MKPILVAKFLVLLGLLIPSAAHAQIALELHGNTKLDSDSLRTYLFAESPSFVDQSGRIREEVVERAVLLLSAYYWDKGYAMVRVDDAKIDQVNRRVDFFIKSEGDRFTIKSVAVTGTLLRTERTFLAMLATKAGSVFSRTKIADDRQKLARFYEDRAYAYVNVLPLTKVDVAAKTIALTFEIDQGEQAFFEQINVDGNTQTSTQSILDMLSFKPTESFHGTKLETSRQRLKKVFPDVAISTKRGTTPSGVIVTIEVNE